jgi:hypothetical protein
MPPTAIVAAFVGFMVDILPETAGHPPNGKT